MELSPGTQLATSPEITLITHGHSSYLPDAPLPLIERNIGDITYESIFVDGQVDTEPKLAYIDEEGVYFDEVPLVALNAEYYKPESITHAEIIDKFNTILLSFDPDPETEIELSGVVDSISYALSVYGEDADILQQLGRVAQAFPERGGATRTGRLFDQFSSAIAGTNRQIKSNDILHKVLYRSPKVIDDRVGPAVNISTETSPTVPDGDGYDSEVIYQNALISREVYYIPTAAGTSMDSDGEYSTWATTSDDPAKALNWGYFFCDFEKVLHRDTDLAQLLDIKKVDKLFGHQLMNSAVKLTCEPGRLARMHTMFGGGTWVGFSFSYFASGRNGEGPDYWDITWPDPNGIQEWTPTYPEATNVSALAMSIPGIDIVPGHSYIALRAVDLASSQGLYSDALGHDYRLMCFEFQDYYTAEIRISDAAGTYAVTAPMGTSYEADITFQDRSLQILNELKEKLQIAVTNFANYEGLASEHCNYNDMGSYFNSFFVNAMNAEYGDNPEESPWVVLTSLYYLYSDLLDSTSDKSLEEIGALVAQQVTKISPNSGTLEGITNFKTTVDALYTQLEGINYDGYDADSDAAKEARLLDGRALKYTQSFDLSDVPLYIGDEVEGEVAVHADVTITLRDPSLPAPEAEWVRVGTSSWTDTAWYPGMAIERDDIPEDWDGLYNLTGTELSGPGRFDDVPDGLSWIASTSVESLLNAFWEQNRGTYAQGGDGTYDSEVLGRWTRIYYGYDSGGTTQNYIERYALRYVFAEITDATFDRGHPTRRFDLKGKMRMYLYECQQNGAPSQKCEEKGYSSSGATGMFIPMSTYD